MSAARSPAPPTVRLPSFCHLALMPLTLTVLTRPPLLLPTIRPTATEPLLLMLIVPPPRVAVPTARLATSS